MFLSLLLSSHPGCSSLAPGFQIPTLAPAICWLKITPMNCHPKRDPGRNFRPKAHPKRSEVKSLLPLEQPWSSLCYCSNNRSNHTHTPNSPLTTIHRAPCSSHRSQKTRGPSGTTNNPSEGARHEYLSSKHSTSTPASTPRHQNPRRQATRL
jgi:hypothetical protein